MKFSERVIIKYCLIEEGKVLLHGVTIMFNKVILNIVDQCFQDKLVGSDKNINEGRDTVFSQGDVTTVNISLRQFFVIMAD